MKKKVKYKGPVNGYGFEATATNTTTAIVFSDVVKTNYYGSAEDMRNNLLQKAVPPYGSIDVKSKKGRKELAESLADDILRLKEEIEYKKLLIQMCRKNKVEIKREQHIHEYPNLLK